MPKLLPEVFVSSAALASWVSREVKNGRLRKLGSRIYIDQLERKPGSFGPPACVVFSGSAISRCSDRRSNRP